MRNLRTPRAQGGTPVEEDIVGVIWPERRFAEVAELSRIGMLHKSRAAPLR